MARKSRPAGSHSNGNRHLSDLGSIVHVTETLDSGVGVYVESLIAYQQASNRFTDVALIASENRLAKSVESSSNTIELYRSSRNPLMFPLIGRKIRGILERLQPDIIHLHSTFPGVYVRSFLPRYAPPPAVIYCAHCWSFAMETAPVTRAVYGLIERRLARKTDAIVNISEADVATARQWGVGTPHDVIIPNGVRPVRYSETPLISIDPSKINIGFVGRFAPQKGLDILLDLLTQNRFPGLAFYLVGLRQDEQSRLPETLAELNIVDWVDHARIDDCYRQFDAVVVPSRWEGGPLVPMEAMRNAKPVIVSNRTSLPELVSHGEDGWVFDLDNPESLRDLLSALDKAELERMGQNALRTYQTRFTDERINEELLGLYERVLARRGHPQD